MKTKNAYKKIIHISEEQSGQRIDNFLFTIFKSIPKSAIYKNIRKGNIQINKRKEKPKYKLNPFDQIYVPNSFQEKQSNKENFFFHKIRETFLKKILIYEDDFLLALNKPSGTPVHSGFGSKIGIIEILRKFRPKEKFLELVHRLDKDTSGILLIAKKRFILRALHKQLREKKIIKNYIALVRGTWKQYSKIVNIPLVKHISSYNRKHTVLVRNDGKPSKTLFKVKERFKLATLVKIIPITGRTHQIRVHAQYIGHPIAFDKRYGDLAFDKKLKMFNINRLFLHAESISFIHPNNGESMKIKTSLDEDLNFCINILRNSQN